MTNPSSFKLENKGRACCWRLAFKLLPWI